MRRPMRICPFDLEHCNRAACASGFCEMASEPTMVPCIDCGTLVILRRGARICIACINMDQTETEEA